MMTKYRHREKGYEVKAIEHPGAMYVGGYHGITTGCIYLATEDFNKLFEPIKEADRTKSHFSFRLVERKKYRHREDRFLVVGATYHEPTGVYHVYDYLAFGQTNFRAKDFEKLFEPIEEYCCDWLRMCVERGIIEKYRDDPDEHVWVWYELDESFTECPFCGAKL